MMDDTEQFEALFKAKYELSRALGRGAFGTVYHARNKTTGEEVVLKILHLPDHEAIARVDRELAVMRDMPSSPHIVRLLDSHISPDGRTATFVSEWIDGPTLQSLVEECGFGLPGSVTAAIARQLCEGLAQMHDKNILHRDIKPPNILISSNGLVKLADFGLAVSTSHKSILSTITTITYASSFVGTLRYAAPEIISADRAGWPSDIYALGMTIAFMLFGQISLSDVSIPHLLSRITKGSFVKELPESLATEWKAILSSVLDPRPENRPSAHELRSRLDIAFPRSDPDDAKAVRDFLQKTGASIAPQPRPPSVVSSAAQPKDEGSLLELVRSLAKQLAKVEAAVADITASFSRTDLQPSSPVASTAMTTTLEARIDSTFSAIRARLAFTWRFSLAMTFVLFAIFVSMVVLAVVFGVLYQKSFWGIFFGSSSVLSLLTVVVWRPMDKMLFTTIAIQQLELVQVNYQRALSGTRDERREAFRDVFTQLDSLLARVTGRSRSH